MSINVTQEFSYETDSLESFQKVLQTMVPVLFHPNGAYSHLNLKTEKPHSFDDGIDHRQYYDQQNRIVEYPLESFGNIQRYEYLLVEPLRMYSGVLVDKIADRHLDLQKAADEAAGKHRKLPLPLPRRVWITTLADYREDSKAQVKCRGFDDLINRTMDLVKKFDSKILTEKCGDGYNDWFNCDDGSVSQGYRMQHRPNGGWNTLDISAVHVYYGK